MPATLPAAFAADLLASLVVFLVALPLCLGIAVASGVPPALGLMTGIVGGIIVGAVQSTPFSVSGPAAGLTVLVLMIVREHGPVFLSAVVLLAGGLQLATGLLRGGRWFRAVPPAVVHGMLAGIGVLIAAGQAHALVGDQARAGGPATVATLPAALLRALEPDRAGATLAGAATIAVMLAWPRVARGRLRVLPAALLAVVAGTVTAQLVGLPVAHVDVPASLLSAVALPGRETLGHLGSWATWLAAVELALVASAETLLCAAAVDSLHHGRRTDYDSSPRASATAPAAFSASYRWPPSSSGRAPTWRPAPAPACPPCSTACGSWAWSCWPRGCCALCRWPAWPPCWWSSG
jgi:MFS superfamily sulfate permease-like transporter